MSEITKACIVAFMKARNWLFDAERRKKTEDGEHVFFKVLGKNFLLTSKVVYGWPSIKWTSWKGNYMLYYHVVLLKVD